MTVEEEQNKIVEQLEMLNHKMEQQNSVGYIFSRGIIYGIGFFIGSAVIATIAFGVLSPWVGQIQWVKDNFERGASMR